MSDASSYVGAAKLIGMLNAPLFLTSIVNEPILTGLGTAAVSVLCLGMSSDSSGPTPFYNKQVESRSLKSLSIISNTNRAVRTFLGCIHAYAAVSFARRWSLSARAEDVKKYMRMVFEVGGIFSDLFIACVWFLTAYFGQ